MKKYIGNLKIYDAAGALLDDFANYPQNNLRSVDLIGKLISFADKHAVKGNCWQYYVAYFIACNVNAFSLACERKQEVSGTLVDVAYADCKNLMDIFNLSSASVFADVPPSVITQFASTGDVSQMPYSQILSEFAERLAKCNGTKAFLNEIIAFYKSYGVGELGLNKAFRVIEKDGKATLLPITCMDSKRLDDIVGYDMQKQEVVANTKAFLEGKKANNVLLYGDMGTGKSSTIKALINEFYHDGLRVIELYKHQFLHISDILSKIALRNYKYILYLDDLSFDDFEMEYKYFKAIIDGGLEVKPDNVLIYATSNRRHLIKEHYSDGNDIDPMDELHKSDTKNEKLSLVARFGLSIYYPSPDQQEYLNIVRILAKKFNVAMDVKDLEKKALSWAMFNGAKSGRMAEQFIHSLLQ
ncbi:MAG: ATP-binding protein [Clostridia bacterium]|jgi:predicted AAA+ superfamily ATPase|nr:ATP-binding protein [Clostridia bacterium]